MVFPLFPLLIHISFIILVQSSYHSTYHDLFASSLRDCLLLTSSPHVYCLIFASSPCQYYCTFPCCDFILLVSSPHFDILILLYLTTQHILYSPYYDNLLLRVVVVLFYLHLLLVTIALIVLVAGASICPYLLLLVLSPFLDLFYSSYCNRLFLGLISLSILTTNMFVQIPVVSFLIFMLLKHLK